MQNKKGIRVECPKELVKLHKKKGNENNENQEEKREKNNKVLFPGHQKPKLQKRKKSQVVPPIDKEITKFLSLSVRSTKL